LSIAGARRRAATIDALLAASTLAVRGARPRANAIDALLTTGALAVGRAGASRSRIALLAALAALLGGLPFLAAFLATLGRIGLGRLDAKTNSCQARREATKA
jgi:hypothetical protein